jgi:hypothetical protein
MKPCELLGRRARFFHEQANRPPATRILRGSAQYSRIGRSYAGYSRPTGVIETGSRVSLRVNCLDRLENKYKAIYFKV